MLCADACAHGHTTRNFTKRKGMNDNNNYIYIEFREKK